MNAMSLTVLAALMAGGTPAERHGPLPALTPETLTEVLSRILPRKQEVKWQAIPWHSDPARALARAATEDKPVLIWAMNGDPLGCT